MNEGLTHGGDWAGFAAVHGRPPLDFSASISPLGVPSGVRAALARAAGEVDRYPDPLCRELRAAIARHEEVPMEHILCGAGAADLIVRAVLALRPRRALVTAPTFAGYQEALALAGCAVERLPLDPARDFRLGEEILSAITPEMDMVFLCQPNNPTGVTVPVPLLRKILERCRQTGVRLVLDECFVDLLVDPAAYTMKSALIEFPNLLLLKAFTKLYAMAGVRLGYALCADRALLADMERAGQPWPVSSLAQAAGVAALKEGAYALQVRSLLAVERPWLAEELRRLGLRVVPGEANYLLFACSAELSAPLAERGILLRRCGNFEGLDNSWYRAAVRTHEENQRLIQALEEVLL